MDKFKLKPCPMLRKYLNTGLTPQWPNSGDNHFRDLTNMIDRSNSEDSKSIPNENVHVTN